MSRVDQVYAPALEGKRIPILPQDEKWQELFAATGKTPEIEAMEGALLEKLAVQAMLRDKIKEIKRLKKKLLNEIVLLRDPASTKGRTQDAIESEIAEHKRMITDCNERLASYEEELEGLPRELYQLNVKLMLATMHVCYQILQSNNGQIETIEAWIDKVRAQLEKNITHLQEREIYSYRIYAYMREIFGAGKTQELFDLPYDPEERRPARPRGGRSS